MAGPAARAALRQGVSALGALSRPARERIAVTGFLLGDESAVDRLLARTYFAAASGAWAEYEEQPDHLVAFRSALASVGAAPERALDLGCGTGGTAAVMAALWPRCEVTGIDSSRRMIRRARERHLAPNLDFRVGDGLRLQVPDATCDLVASLNYLPFPGEVARVLRPAGHVVVASTFQPMGSGATEAHWRAHGFTLLDRADADRGSFEVYRYAA